MVENRISDKLLSVKNESTPINITSTESDRRKYDYLTNFRVSEQRVSKYKSDDRNHMANY